MNQNSNRFKINKISQYIYLNNFNKKTSLQSFTSITYNSIFGLISLVGLVPIIIAFIGTTNFDYNIFNLCFFSFSFFFIVDLIIRMFLLKSIHRKHTYFEAFKKQLLSLSGYIQLASWVLPFFIVLSFGKFNDIGVEINNNTAFTIFIVATSVLFLLNLIFCVTRFISISNSKWDLDIFKKVLFSKLKLILISIILVFTLSIIFGFILYSIEQPWPEPGIDDSSKFKTMFDAIYFAIITITTVGFGDIVATKSVSKAIVIVLIIIGIFIYSFLTSQFIDTVNEYYKRKKAISIETSSNKRIEQNNRYLLSEMNKMILKNLFDSGIITKNKYNRLLRKSSEQKEYYTYNENDFELDAKTKSIYFKGELLGNLISDQDVIQEAEDREWAIDYANKSLDGIENALYFLTMKAANTIASEDYFTPIIFTRKILPPTIKKLIIYQKKPYLSAVGEVDVVAIHITTPEEAWKKYSKFSNISSLRFKSLFSSSKSVTIIFIKNIIEYYSPKLFEHYGFKDNEPLRDIIPII